MMKWFTVHFSDRHLNCYMDFVCATDERLLRHYTAAATGKVT